MNKSEIIGFWSEHKNVRSMGRLLASALIFTACLIALAEIGFCLYQYAWTVKDPYEVHVGLILGLGGTGGGSKIIAKIWGKYGKSEDTEG